MTHFLNAVDLIIINEEIIGQQSQLRDIDLLESAVERPKTSAFGEDAYPTVIDKAAAFFHSLSRNHAFVDGNKRTSVVALITFLDLNGYTTTWEPQDALDFILKMATGQLQLADIVQWLNTNTTELQ